MRGENVEVYWGVEDAEAISPNCWLQAPPPTSSPPTSENIIVASVKDPWGNILGIIKNPHFKL